MGRNMHPAKPFLAFEDRTCCAFQLSVESTESDGKKLINSMPSHFILHDSVGRNFRRHTTYITSLSKA